MAPPRKDTITPTSQAKSRLRDQQAKRQAAARRKRAQDKVRTKPKKDWAAEAARLEKEATTLRARAKKEKAKGSGFDAEYTKGAREAAAKAAAARKKAGLSAKPLVTPKGSSGPAPSTSIDGTAAIAAVNRIRGGTKPVGRPASRPAAPALGPSGGGGGSTARGAVPTAGVATAGAPAAGSVAPGAVDAEFSKRFAHMQWAWTHPELGPVLREAAEKGYNENELTGRLFQTEWFRVYGTANAVAQLRDTADEYLVKLTDGVAQQYAMQLISKEIQPAQVAAWVKEQAKSRYPTLAAAIDSGVTVKQYANTYVTDAAATLEMNPEAIDLADPKWGRPLEGNADPKTGERVAMNRYDWITMLKSDPVYAPLYDRTAQARTGAAQFASQLQQRFGRAG